MYINTFKYTPKDVSCQLCTEYVKKLGCTALRCPWLAKRIEAGVVGYREAVLETFPHERRLFQRLNLLIKHYPGSLWSNEQHERRIKGNCLFVSLEMSPEQITAKRISRLTGLSSARMLGGSLSDEEWTKIAVASSALSEQGVFLNSRYDLTVQQIQLLAQSVPELKAVIVDLPLFFGYHLATNDRKRCFW